MSEYTTFPAEGIYHLIIEEMTRDAQVWGAVDATELQITYQPSGSERAQTFMADGDVAVLSNASVQRITVPASMNVTVKRASGDLHVRGLGGAVNIEAVRGDVRLGSLWGTTRLARIDGDLRAEEVADLRLLGACAGDLRFESGGNLEAETIAGDVRIAGATEVRLGRVHGDLWIERVEGAFQAERVSGDARLNEIGGPATLRTLHGDLRVIAATGGLSAPQVQGDAIVQGPFSPQANYALTTNGDVSLALPADTDARLTVRAHGRIRSDVHLTPTADGTPTFTATIGQGTGRVNVVSGGDMRITQAGAASPRVAADIFDSATPEDLRNLGESIRRQVTTSLAAAGIMVEGGHGPRPARPARPASPARPAAPQPPASMRPPAPPQSTVEEQLRILKMVESGVITAEQAELLLKALEG
jgi:DUF4097 and DUF4098 domain-containing protein YvlB